MRKTFLSLGLAGLLALPATPPAAAQLGFFDGIFGGPRQPRINQQGSSRRLPWWMRKGNGDREDAGAVRRTYQPPLSRDVRRSKPVPNYADPETDPGLGMGNLTYEQPHLVALVESGPTEPATADALSLELWKVLSKPAGALMVEPDLKKPLLAFYNSRGYKPVWVVEGKIDPRALQLAAVAAGVSDEGLKPEDYLPQGFTSFTDLAQEAGTSPGTQARFDVALTAAALKLSQHLSGGQLDPEKLSKYNDLPSQRIKPDVALRILTNSPYPDRYLRSLSPTHAAYGMMKAELAKLRQDNAGSETSLIANGPTVKRGGQDGRMVQVRDRLQALGFLSADDSAVDPEYASELDEALVAALKSFQASSSLKETGQLNAATVSKLNSTNRSSDIERLVMNLERLRWFPKEFGQRYVFVNQPAFEVQVMNQGQVEWRSNVIIGRPMTQTASFYDEVETVVFNPSWGVPQSIIVNEYVRKLIRDPGYLDREGFKVINQRGQVVSSRSINWAGYSSKSPLGVQQPPGSDNALGELKFLFPNAHSIYMHDTPTKPLFSEKVRAFSHGCVRVQNPREFAEVLLGWNRAKIDKMVDSKKSESIPLNKHIPIYITYFTAWPDDTGSLHYYADIYGRDATMQQALSGDSLKQAANMTRSSVPN